MGVYVYKSNHMDAIKVGHYCKNNAWSRIAHRGFYSCRCPDEIKDKVSIEDLNLLCWYPKLTPKDEKILHKDLIECTCLSLGTKRVRGEIRSTQSFQFCKSSFV